jgi:hypothetical protein
MLVQKMFMFGTCCLCKFSKKNLSATKKMVHLYHKESAESSQKKRRVQSELVRYIPSSAIFSPIHYEPVKFFVCTQEATPEQKMVMYDQPWWT